jgi:hypothetical protein
MKTFINNLPEISMWTIMVFMIVSPIYYKNSVIHYNHCCNCIKQDNYNNKNNDGNQK